MSLPYNIASTSAINFAPAGFHSSHGFFGSADDVKNYFPGNEKKTRLLIVDDDDVDRERINRYIRKFKLPVFIIDARNGSEALQHILRDEIDLILLDYQLGDMTGTEMLSEIKHRQKSPIPTIMVTGMGDEGTAIEAMRLGVFDYLPKKTLTPESLMSVLTSALHSADLEKRLQQSQENLRRMSLYDALTGLPNRNLFFDRLNQSILIGNRKGGAFTVLMIDLNLFKEINDSLGHQAGDDALSVIGTRLEATARKSDTIARLGGDEFACILHDVQTIDNAISCAVKIIEAISQPIAISNRIIHVGASIGIARYPEHGKDPTTLLSNADCAMYRAKKSNRKYDVYNNDIEHTSIQHAPVSEQLYKAIKNHELFLEYQPKVNLHTHEVTGAEALVRWNNPETGLIMPGTFIPIAERSRLIEDLTYLTIDMAFADYQRWKQSSVCVPIAINISARMLDNTNLPRILVAKAHDHQVDTRNITLEITETTLASSNQEAYRILAELGAAGFKLSIDDFGSGFTSFASIRNIEISELKIDRMFVSKIQSGKKDAAIVHSMLLLADNLDMHAIAEGVETREQWDILKTLGCDYAQGYGIARPMSASSLPDWIATFQASAR